MYTICLHLNGDNMKKTKTSKTKHDKAKRIIDEDEIVSVCREDRLRELGFEEPTQEQRKANLALNIALLEWPND